MLLLLSLHPSCRFYRTDCRHLLSPHLTFDFFDLQDLYYNILQFIIQLSSITSLPSLPRIRQSCFAAGSPDLAQLTTRFHVCHPLWCFATDLLLPHLRKPTSLMSTSHWPIAPVIFSLLQFLLLTVLDSTHTLPLSSSFFSVLCVFLLCKVWLSDPPPLGILGNIHTFTVRYFTHCEFLRALLEQTSPPLPRFSQARWFERVWYSCMFLYMIYIYIFFFS